MTACIHKVWKPALVKSMSWGHVSPAKQPESLRSLLKRRLLGAFEILSWGNFILLWWSAPVQEGSLEEFTDAKVTFWWLLAACQVRSEPSSPSSDTLTDSSSLFVLFSLHRTGLEAIMETYAFWRPPVRTLTFEDFTTMQKQQGECAKGCRKSRRRGCKSSNVLCCVSGGLAGSCTSLSSWLLWKDTEQREWMETGDKLCLMRCNAATSPPWCP